MHLRLPWGTDCSVEDDQDWLKRVGTVLVILLYKYFVLYWVLCCFYCDQSRSQSVTHCIDTFSVLLINFVKNRFIACRENVWRSFLSQEFPKTLEGDLRSSVLLCSVHRYLDTDVSGPDIGCTETSVTNYISTLTSQRSEDLTPAAEEYPYRLTVR